MNDFRPPHEETGILPAKRTMHSEDAERLELLELLAENSGADLERALRYAEQATENVERCRIEHRRRAFDRDTFRSALEGMGCKTK